MIVSVAIAGVLGVVGAWAASTVGSCGGWWRLLSQLFFVSMIAAVATPMILHAAAWEATAGKFGWLPLTQTGARATGVVTTFNGLFACGWIHGLASTAFVALAVWYGTRTLPAEVAEQARMEFGPTAVWWCVRLPHALPWLLASLLATATLAATEMTVVDLYGFRTIADEFYLFYSTSPTLSSIIKVCLVPTTIGLVIAALHWMRSHRIVAVRSQINEVAVVQPPGKSTRIAAGLLVVAIAALVIIVPMAGLLVKVGHEVAVQNGERTATWSISQCVSTLARAPKTFSSEYTWTALIGACVSFVAVVLGWLCAAVGRSNHWCGLFFDAISLALVLLPGPIVGLAIVYLFQLPVPGFHDLYHASLVPTIMALLFRAGPVAYWIIRTGYRGIDDTLLQSAQLELSVWQRFWSVQRPLVQRSLITAALAAGIVASGDVPAMLPVLPAKVTTVGTRLFGLLHSGARYQEAALAFWYVGSIIALALFWLRWGGGTRAKL